MPAQPVPETPSMSAVSGAFPPSGEWKMENYDDRTRCFQKTNFPKGKTFSIFNSQFSIRPERGESALIMREICRVSLERARF
jgi:hypothetical protein